MPFSLQKQELEMSKVLAGPRYSASGARLPSPLATTRQYKVGVRFGGALEPLEVLHVLAPPHPLCF